MSEEAKRNLICPLADGTCGCKHEVPHEEDEHCMVDGRCEKCVEVKEEA